MALSNLIVFFLFVMCFMVGACCFYIPFRIFKKKIARLIKPSSPRDAPPLPSEDQDALTGLSDYIARTQNRIEHQEHELSFWRDNMSSLANAAESAVLVLNQEGDLVFHNKQSVEIFYLEKSSSRLNEIVRSPDVTEIFHQCLQKEEIVQKECGFRKKDRHITSVFKVTAVPVIHKELNLKHIILLFYDLTDIKESQQAHVDFVSNVSHELKTPLTAVQGYVEMLMDDFARKKTDQFENFLRILLRNCKRMGSLVDDLLSLSNLISQAHLEKQKLNTEEITRRVVECVDLRGHRLNFNFSAPYVTAHPRWVEIVLHNLIDNACRHTPKECEVRVSWEQEGDRVVLKVVDTGEGVLEKYRERIFERFFRIDPARSREKGGTGVGLALVKQSMEKHGGRVRVKSPPSGGTEFVCEFPNNARVATS